MKASLSNFKQSPRKVRLVADLMRGKSVAAAQDALVFLAKKSAPEMEKLLASAVANARMKGMNPEDLFIKTISVDKGSVLRRMTPKARGRAAGIRRTFSHVSLELGTKQVVGNREQVAVKKAAKKRSSKKTSNTKT